MFKLKKIGSKFSVAVISTVIVIMTLISFIRYVEFQRNIPNEVEANLSKTIHAVSIAVSDPLWNYNIKGVQIIADTFFQNDEIASIIITDLNRGLIYEKNKQGDAYAQPRLTFSQINIYREEQHIGIIEIELTDYFLMNELKQFLISLSQNSQSYFQP